MAARGSFSGTFTRRNCSHEQIFHSEYQRTNRTKENKILRCFPHCCPEHVRRSYCGSSLHLQVDFHAGDLSSPSTTFRQPARDDDLLVFGRFRPRESRGFRVGDRIAGATILSSLQSEDNPTGEWIEAWLIASADRNAWLYEVNHSARWYYNWGSSAAKDKRLKEHVFEAYILYQSSGPLVIAEESARDGRSAADSFQVAAVSCSPPFKLLSFRRAPAETRKRGHADANAEQVSLSEEEVASGDGKNGKRGAEQEGKEPRWARASVRAVPPTQAPLPRPSQDLESAPIHDWERAHNHGHDRHHHHHQYRGGEARHEEYDRAQSSWRSFPPTSSSTMIPLSSGSAFGSTLSTISFTASTIGTMMMSQRSNARFPPFPPSSSSSPFTSFAAKRPRFEVSQPERSLKTAAHSRADSLTWRHAQQDYARLETRVPTPSLHSAFLGATGVTEQRPRTQLDDIIDVFAALRALSLAEAASAVSSLESTYQGYVAQVGRRKHDRHTAVPRRSSAYHDVERLLSQLGHSAKAPAHPMPRRLPSDLVDAAAHLALWLQCEPDLACARASIFEHAAAVLLNKPALAEVHERFVCWLHTQIDSFLHRRCGWSLRAFLLEIARADRSAERDVVGAVTAPGSSVTFMDFVAQVREVFLDYQATKRQCRGHADRHRRLPETPFNNSSRLDGIWHSELSSVRLRHLGHVEIVPLDALLLFWKQLGSVYISSHVAPSPTNGSSTRIVELRSVFAPTRSSGLRLVTDGRPRWFRTFPSGESASANHIGTQSFGDYRAVCDATRDTIECAMYSWPTTRNREGDGPCGSMTTYAYCWRWQITSIGSTATASKLAVQVHLVLERGCMEQGASPLALALEPLARKCDCVRKWDRVLLADWSMEA